jgi:hypothetical protein
MTGKDRKDLVELALSHAVNRTSPLQERHGGIEPSQSLFPTCEDLVKQVRDLPQGFQAVADLR